MEKKCFQVLYEVTVIKPGATNILLIKLFF